MATNKRQQAYAMFAVGGLAVLGIVGWNFKIEGQAKPNALGCIGIPTRSTVIVIDQTQGLASQTQEEIYRRVQAVVNDDEAVRVGEMVSVFTVDELTRLNFKPQFEHCKPPSTGRELDQNPRGIRLAKEREFDKPLRDVLARKIPGADQSPIAEALSDLSRTQYLRAPEQSRLLVYSDLLQHSKALSLYGCVSGAQAIIQYKSARAGGVQRPEFKNLQVVLNPVPRGGLTEQNVACRAQFWNWFLGNIKGANAFIEVDPLPGPVGP